MEGERVSTPYTYSLVFDRWHHDNRDAQFSTCVGAWRHLVINREN